MITKLKVYAGTAHPHVGAETRTHFHLVFHCHGNSIRQINAFIGTGRRKTSVARVRSVPGSGKIVVNDRTARTNT